MQDEQFWLIEFEQHRPRLRGLAYRMLGSVAEADDALQESWLRVARASGPDVDNPGGWLTTVVSRQCLNQLRQRAGRREDALPERLPDLVVEPDRSADTADPAEQAGLVDSVSIALLVVLEALEPDERLAFVLHDMFAVPYDEIAPMLDRSVDAARQLASRGRRRVQHQPVVPPPDRRRQREIADAWLAAARGGDLDALVAMLHPDAVLRVDTGGVGSKLVHGAAAIAENATAFRAAGLRARFAVVNGGPGLITTFDGRTTGVLAFTVVDGLIVEVDILTDPERLARIDTGT